MNAERAKKASQKYTKFWEREKVKEATKVEWVKYIYYKLCILNEIKEQIKYGRSKAVINQRPNTNFMKRCRSATRKRIINYFVYKGYVVYENIDEIEFYW